MSSNRNLEEQVMMTREGYEKLKNDLTVLKTDRRTEIAAKLEEARAFGDLSENAEYHAAKEEQEKLEGRISRLEYQLSKAKIVEAVDTNTVNLGTSVTLLDMGEKKSYTYTLVGSEEADPKRDKISASSPVGREILGKAIGEEVHVKVPKGQRHLKITDINIL